MSADYCKCPNCAGKLEYRADHRKFGCDSCQSFFSDEQIKKLFKGKNHSGSADSQDDGSERPAFTVPFEISREQALEIFRENAASKKFLPSGLVSSAPENIRGVYRPVWMADSEVSVKMNGTGKKVRAWICDVHQYTETREYASERKAEAMYSGVPAEYSGEQEVQISADGYDFSRMRKFADEDLEKYSSEYISVNRGEAFRNVRGRVTEDIRRVLKKSVSDYSDFSVTNENIDILRTDWYYTLLPVWVISWTQGSREHSFTVNGQTGEFTGRMPVSLKKLGLTAGAVLVLITFIYRAAELMTGFAGDATAAGYFFKSTGAGILLGVIAAAVSSLFILKDFREKKDEKPVSEICPGDNDIKFTMKTDRYVRQYTTKIKTEE